MKIIKSKNWEKIAQRYKSDEEIEAEFSDMQIVNIEVKPSRTSGWVELYFPDAGESVGGGTQYVTDSWIKYDLNNRIAFDKWYPPLVYQKIVAAIEDKLKESDLGTNPNSVDNGETDTPLGQQYGDGFDDFSQNKNKVEKKAFKKNVIENKNNK